MDVSNEVFGVSEQIWQGCFRCRVFLWSRWITAESENIAYSQSFGGLPISMLLHLHNPSKRQTGRPTSNAWSTLDLGIFVHVRCKITSCPILTICSASSNDRSAVAPPAPHVTDIATGRRKGDWDKREIRSSRLARPASVRGGKNSNVWNGPVRSSILGGAGWGGCWQLCLGNSVGWQRGNAKYLADG